MRNKYDTPATAQLPLLCKSCGAQRWRILRKRTIATGSMVYPYCCQYCGWISPVCEKRDNVLSWLADKDVDTDALEWATNAAQSLNNLDL